MRLRSTLRQSDLHRWLTYEAATGLFFWREKPSRNICIGSQAGTIGKQHEHKRRVLWVDGRRIYASRAAYIHVHGDIPDAALVDHIDGDRLNDRIENLRLASDAQNTWNRIQRVGTEYKLGVAKDVRGRFKARIQMPDGQKLNIGTWDSEAEAHAAYMGAAAVLHSDFWIGNRQQDGDNPTSRQVQ